MRIIRSIRSIRLLRSVRTMGIGAALSLILLMQGCAGSKDIQSMAYVTALGLDYVNGNYIAYVQVLNFSNVARTENMQLGKEIPIWIGVGDGETVSGAISDVNVTSQLRIFWGHLKAVVLTENVLREGVVETYNALNRFREIRYNVLVYGTKEKLKDILVQKSLLNLSPLDTIMFTAAQLNSQRSYILPVMGNHVIANLNEPADSAMLPSLAIARHNWSEDKKEKPMFEISGAYFFEDHKMKDWMSVTDLKGVRWAEENLERTPVRIPKKGPPAAVLMLIKPHLSIRSSLEDGSARFDLSVQVNGYVNEMLENMPIPELERIAAEVIREEITATYRKALLKHCDPFNLREALYRKWPNTYKRLALGDHFFLDADSIRSINVKVRLTSTGKYKGRTQ